MPPAMPSSERVERIEPPADAEGEFIEVGLQVLVIAPVMGAVQPRFQVCEDEMDDWQILTPSRSAIGRVVAEVERPTCRVSGWTPDRQTKTIRSAACGKH